MKILRPKDLSELLSVSIVTLWRMEKRGELLPRKQFSRGIVGWLDSDIEAWLKSRPNVNQQRESKKVKA